MMDLPTTPEELAALAATTHAPEPAQIEGMVRLVRRMVHAVDPTFELESPEPFDLAGEAATVRAKVVGIALTPEPMAVDFLRFLHPQAEDEGDFEEDRFAEMTAIGDAAVAGLTEVEAVTSNIGAQAWAMADVMIHAMTESQLLAAYRQAQVSWVESGRPSGSLTAIDWSVEQTLLLVGFHLSEYSDVFQREGA